MRESSYNVLVQQIERCSDHLKHFTDSVVFPDDDEIAANILKRMRRLIADLDQTALRCLAPYDPYAKHCLANKVMKDPRRTGHGPTLFEGVALALAAIPDELKRLAKERTVPAKKSRKVLKASPEAKKK
jgi:hypothetical protein